MSKMTIPISSTTAMQQSCILFFQDVIAEMEAEVRGYGAWAEEAAGRIAGAWAHVVEAGNTTDPARQAELIRGAATKINDAVADQRIAQRLIADREALAQRIAGGITAMKGAGAAGDIVTLGLAVRYGTSDDLGRESSKLLAALTIGPWAAAFGAAAARWLVAAFFGGTAPIWLVGLAIGGGAYLAARIGEIVWDKFALGSDYQVLHCDPLMLDLDGDGIETVGYDRTAPIYFDLDGDGVSNSVGWAKPDDGFLVLDRNGNGSIDSGAELFGDATPLAGGGAAADGFAALAQEDTNADGMVSAADARFAQLRVWRDLNQDGISQSGELFSLSSLDIASIKVAATARNQTLVNGNKLVDVGTYTKTGGTVRTMGEVVGEMNLAVDTFHRQFTDRIPLAPGVDALPDMQGSGKVRDLQEAASQSSILQSVLTQYAAATTRAGQRAMLDDLVTAWAGTAGMQTMEERTYGQYHLIWAALGAQTRAAHVVPGGGYLTGSGPVGGNTSIGDGLPPVDQVYRDLIAHWQQRFAVLEAFNGRTFFVFPGESGQGAKTGAAVSKPRVGAPSVAGRLIPDLNITLAQTQLDALEASYQALLDSVYDGLLLQTRFLDVLDGITVRSAASGEVMDFSGAMANLQNRIAANAAQGLGDLIEFNRATQDMLAGTGWNGWSRLETELRARPLTPELAAMYADLNVRIEGGAGYSASGTTKRDIILGGATNSTLSGADGDDALFGGDGADTLGGGSADDYLAGGAGNDTLRGEAGDDVLDGGTGNDTLDGGPGNDTYLFARGGGQDIINALDRTTGRVDSIVFEAGILPADVTVLRDAGSHLYLKIAGSTDQVKVDYAFANDMTYGKQIDEVRFVDAPGVVWDIATLKAKAITSTAGNDYLIGYATNDVLSGGAGNDAINGAGGDDTIDGGEGNDALGGGDGNDVVLGNAGADTMNGENGNDTLLGGADADSLSGAAGDDVLDGGAGNDTLNGGAGSDTYLFGRGDGQDLAASQDPTVGKLDKLVFKAGVRPTDVAVTRDASSNLLLTIAGTTDQFKVAAYFQADATHGNQLEEIRFTDAPTVVWDIATVKAKAITGTPGNDYLIGYATNDALNGGLGNDAINGAGGNDRIDGGEGNDALGGGEGNDVVLGGAGADTANGENGNDMLLGGADADSLWGGNGDDLLEGGTGNDALNGGAGSDTYYFGRGDGQDSISGQDTTAGKVDRIVFKSGILPADVSVTRDVSNHLYLKLAGTTDQVRVASYFLYDATRGDQVEEIRFADAQSVVWDVATVKAKAITGTAGADYLIGYASNDYIAGLAGIDTIYGSGGTDVLQGGAGNDIVSDTAGNGMLDGGDDNDVITGGAGNELFIGGKGTDSLATGTGFDIIAFNRGDGADTVVASNGADNTLSLGGGIRYADLLFRRSGANLILDAGGGDRITFTGWYGAATNKSVVNLQLVADAMIDFDASAKDPMKNKRVTDFDFAGLAGAFDAALLATPALTSWALTNALSGFQLSGSDTQAIGGDLAYQYGHAGSLAGIGVTPAQSVLAAAQFGSTAQTLQPVAGLQAGAQRLG